MKKFDPTLNTVFTDDGKPVIAPIGRPSGSIIESIGENLNVMTLGDELLSTLITSETSSIRNI